MKKGGKNIRKKGGVNTKIHNDVTKRKTTYYAR